MELDEVETLARQVMREYNLFSQGWRFTFDNARKRAGLCTYPHAANGNRGTISLSRYIMQLWPEAEVRDTILHEVAHALAGSDADHGWRWQQLAGQLGARPSRCYSYDLPQPEAPWVGICPNGHEVRRHRQPTRVAGCGRCSRRFAPQFIIRIWEHHGQRVEPSHPEYVADMRRTERRYQLGIYQRA